MKLLFDENPSPRLVGRFATTFPECTHVDLGGLHGRSDREVWEHARTHGYTIVSKDNDFRQLSFLHGGPPKVVWLSVGNAGTALGFARDEAANFAKHGLCSPITRPCALSQAGIT